MLVLYALYKALFALQVVIAYLPIKAPSNRQSVYYGRLHLLTYTL